MDHIPAPASNAVGSAVPMPSGPCVMLVGSTGRTGRRVLEQLLARGVRVRTIARSSTKLPAAAAAHSNLTIVEADLMSLSAEELQARVRGCDAIISCLGHNLSLKGIYGRPHDLVTQAAARLCRAAEAHKPATPVKFILMSSVSVQRAGKLDARRGSFERTILWMISHILLPANDNQRAAALLSDRYGADHNYVRWVVVRPDSLLDGEVSEYTLHEGLVSSLFAPDSTSMANVAHFMCVLVTNETVWEQWQGKLPVIINAAGARQAAR